MTQILMIPRIKVQNANALSSPYTIGFPAMTAWLGAAHALQRKLNIGKLKDINFLAVGVVCHDFNLHAYRDQGGREFSIIGTGNPLDHNGDRAAFIEEARCNLEISLLISYERPGLQEEDDFCLDVTRLLWGGIKIAGGDILGFQKPALVAVWDDVSLKRILRKLMPGYALIERRDLMIGSMKNGADAIDALLEHLKIDFRGERNEEGAVSWEGGRKNPGWIVPIATGFQGLTPLSLAKNQRDSNTKHRFAESIVTLGEFVMPYKIKEIDGLLWRYSVDLENNIYSCTQNLVTNQS